MILVTGGAGYIGRHLVAELLTTGHKVLVVDDLRSGNRFNTEGVPFFAANVGDATTMREIFSTYRISVVIHLAGSIQVGESMRHPEIYWENNVNAAHRLFDCAREGGVKRVIFSSSAAVYGEPLRTPIPEDHPTKPISPYGETNSLWKTSSGGSLRQPFFGISMPPVRMRHIVPKLT